MKGRKRKECSWFSSSRRVKECHLNVDSGCGRGLLLSFPFFVFAFLLLTSDDKDINNDYDNLIE